MSIELSKAELGRFLQSSTPEILCLRGSWGVGKTYALREVIRDAAASNAIALERYAYVSLFGLDELKTVRSAIFDNTIKVENIPHAEPENIFDTFADLESMARKAKGLQLLLPGNWGKPGATALIDRAANAFVRNQIICFDDLERSSESVNIKDVMGLATQLKEERGCKVVLILNDKKLSGKGKDDFNSQFEKVVDSSIVFEPNSDEVIEIAFRKEFEGSEYAKEVVAKLGLTNIRVISKIIRIVVMIAAECNLSEEDLRQVIATSSLAAWVKFEGGSAVSLEDLKSFNALVMRMRSQHEGADPIPEWVSKPDSIGYGHSDVVDDVIIDALDKGYIDPEAFAAAKALQEKEGNNVEENSEFANAWKQYHGRLDLSDKEVVNSLFESMRSNYEGVSLLSFNGTVVLFRELGFDDLADKSIGEYFAAREFGKDDLDDEVIMWGRDKVDHGIEAHFDKLKRQYVDERDPLDVLVTMAVNTSWDNEDIDLLSSLSVDELVSTLDRVPGDMLTRVIKLIMRFVRSKESEFAKFRQLSHEALAKIADRSSNNRRKLKAMGFVPTPTKP